ncbi:MAG: AAA family ATPase [Ilumatobacteraceae bacterium]
MDLPAGSVVVIDEAGMVDTRLMHEYSQIARAKNWRTALVGDHRQLGSVEAGGLFAELVADPGVTTVELDTLHRFEHDWEADASLALRDGDSRSVDTYDCHGRVHGHTDQVAAVDAVADEAFSAIVTGRDVPDLTNLDNGHRHAIPADYIAAGNVSVRYASTINRAQGATVDEAHLIIDDRTSAAQIYVGITRGRHANHVHTAPPSFDPERHGPPEAGTDWTPSGAVTAAAGRRSDQMSATSRRRTLRTLAAEARNQEPDRVVSEPASEVGPTHDVPERVAAARRRLAQLARRESTSGLER